MMAFAKIVFISWKHEKMHTRDGEELIAISIRFYFKYQYMGDQKTAQFMKYN